MPLYETTADRENEDNVIRELCRVWKCTAVKSPRQAGSDVYLDKKDKRVAHVEIKCRKNISDKYSTYMVDATKLRAGLERARLAQVPYLLIVRFLNGIFWVLVDENTVAENNCRMGGARIGVTSMTSNCVATFPFAISNP